MITLKNIYKKNDKEAVNETLPNILFLVLICKRNHELQPNPLTLVYFKGLHFALFVRRPFWMRTCTLLSNTRQLLKSTRRDLWAGKI